jgi:hypothetical protein
MSASRIPAEVAQLPRRPIADMGLCRSQVSFQKLTEHFDADPKPDRELSSHSPRDAAAAAAKRA